MSVTPYDSDDFARPSGDYNGDYRNEFAHDRDRIIYADSMRRLADKTQVVAVGETGTYHTRLTHSLKVGQVGRRLAEKLGDIAVDRGDLDPSNGLLAPNPDLIEAACLAHDIGHPPFGHVGEEALSTAVDRYVAKELQSKREKVPAPSVAEQQAAKLDRGGFEGNAQSFRTLGYLESHRNSHGRGLDLTRATLDAVTKYPWRRGEGDKSERKWGCYDVDAELMMWVRPISDGGTSAGDGLKYPQPLAFEAELMDWCDDVTYAVHDVEDFYRHGFIPLERLFDFRGSLATLEAEEQARFFDNIESAGRLEWFDRAEARTIWRNLANLVTISEPFRPTRAVLVSVDRTRSKLISFFVDAVSYEGDYPARHRATLSISDLARKACDLLNQLIWYYVIDRPALLTQQVGKRHVVRSLFEAYTGNSELLPDDRKEEFQEHQDLPRACADHVASLTEQQALALFHRFTGVDLGDLGSPIWLS